MPTVLFRCDGGAEIGIGHLMRCRTLAAALGEQGWVSMFAMTQASATFFASDTPFVVPDGLAGSVAVKAIMTAQHADCLVVDHYRLDAEFERQAATRGALTVVVDDLANRPHDCDLLIDINPARSPSDYAPHTPGRTKLLLGTRYALLRSEFAQIRRVPDNTAPAQASRLVIAPGGADPTDVSTQLLEAVPRLEAAGLATTLIVGRANPRQATLTAHGRALGADVVCDPADPVALMASADIAISGAGTTCLEFACLGVPTVALVLADNQRDVAKAIGDAGAARILDGAVVAARIAETVITIAADQNLRTRMSAAGRALVDGAGAARVADEVTRLHAVRKLEQ
jgi:UDP-2,4-diacetamido-2,4,6-trideoxy-beta-L-altropyranose hydrolase